MALRFKFPLTPLKNGVQNTWFPTFVGMSGIVVAACSPAQSPVSDAPLQEVPQSSAQFQTAQSRTIDDIDFSQYSLSLANYTDLRVGQSRIAAIDVVRLLHAPEQGAKIVKTSSATFDMEGGSVMLLSASGLADDSVHSEEFFLIFEGEGNTQKLAEYGLRVKCTRGENTTDWQKTPCP